MSPVLKRNRKYTVTAAHAEGSIGFLSFMLPFFDAISTAEWTAKSRVVIMNISAIPVLPATRPMQVKNLMSAPPMLPVLNRSSPSSSIASEIPSPSAAPAAGSHQFSWYWTKAAADIASIMLNSSGTTLYI